MSDWLPDSELVTHGARSPFILKVALRDRDSTMRDTKIALDLS